MRTWIKGATLRNLVKVIAALEMALCVVISIPTTLSMLDVCFEGKLGVFIEYAFGVPRTVQLLILLAFWTLIVIKFILDATLYRGADKKNFEALKIWLVITSGVLTTCYFWSILSLNMFWTKRACLQLVISNLVIGVFKGLEIMAVYKMMQKVKKDDEAQHVSRATRPISITDFGFDNQNRSLHNRSFSVERPTCDNNNARVRTQESTEFNGYKII